MTSVSSSRGSSVERLIAAERWREARASLRRLLADQPDDHWLLARLALTYYEQGAYRRALEIESRAARIAPSCPLVLWDLAGSHQMLGHHKVAADLYRRLLRRGVGRLASGRCGEGVRWARGLVADSWYRLGRSHEALHEPRRAKRAYRRALMLRPGGASIYAASEIRARLRALAE